MSGDQTTGGQPIRIAMLLCFAAGGLYGWSAMIPALNASFSTSSEQAGLVFSLAIVVFTAAVLLAPRLPPSWRGLKGAGFFGLAGAACLGAAGAASNFGWFLIAYSGGFGLASGAIYILVLEIAAASDKPRRATAFMVAAFGLGGVVFGPVQRLLVANDWGLAALWVIALTLLLSALVSILSSSRSFVDAPKQQQPPEPVKKDIGHPVGWGKMLLLWAGFGLGSAAGLMVLGLATTIIETRGGAVWLSSLAIFGIAGGNTLGRLSAGVMDSWLDIKWMVPLATGLSALGLIFAVLFTTPLLSAIGLVAVATGYGLNASSFPILTRHFSGPVTFAGAFAIVFTAWGLAGLSSPWLAGRAFDLTGSFTLPLVCALVASLAALVISLTLAKEMSKNPG